MNQHEVFAIARELEGRGIISDFQIYTDEDGDRMYQFDIPGIPGTEPYKMDETYLMIFLLGVRAERGERG